MTRDLDCAVAEALGWHIRTCAPYGEECPWRDYVLADKEGMRIGIGLTEEEAWQNVPHFSTDMSEAWRLVELLAAEGYTYAVEGLEPGGKPVRVSLFPATEELAERQDCSADADTPAAAICEAFLKVRGKK